MRLPLLWFAACFAAGGASSVVGALWLLAAGEPWSALAVAVAPTTAIAVVLGPRTPVSRVGGVVCGLLGVVFGVVVLASLVEAKHHLV